MADKVKLKGVKVLLNQTGSDITIENPKRGGDTHLFPQWFEKKGNVQYLTLIFCLSNVIPHLYTVCC